MCKLQPHNGFMPSFRRRAHAKCSLLLDRFAFGMLVGKERCFNQLAFATHDYARKSFEPCSFRNIRVAIKPGGEQRKLIRANLSIRSNKC